MVGQSPTLDACVELGTPDMQTELCGFCPLMIDRLHSHSLKTGVTKPDIAVVPNPNMQAFRVGLRPSRSLSLSHAAIENHVFHISKVGVEIMGLPW